MRYQNGKVEIIALSQQQLLQFENDFDDFLTSLQLPPQKRVSSPRLQEITLTMIIPNIVKHPKDWPLYTRWIGVERATGNIVGECMIKHGISADGIIDIGYGTYEAFEGRGFMTQIVDCIVGWATEHPDIRHIIAETYKKNVASQRVLAKNYFSIAEHRPDDLILWRIDV